MTPVFKIAILVIAILAAGFYFGVLYSQENNYQLPRSEYEKIDYPVCDWRSVKVKCEQFMRK